MAAFRRLARSISRRSRLIIVLWVAVLALSLPFALHVGDIQSSGSGGFDIPDAESVKASDIIDKQFPRAFANSSAIIVIQNGNVTDVKARDFVLDLEARLTAQGAQPNLTDFTSVYSLERLALTETALQTAPLLAGVKFNAFVVWGVPATYLGAWSASLTTAPNLTTSERDDGANNATLAFLAGFTAGLDPASSAFVNGSYAAFYGAWVANASGAGDSQGRMTTAVHAAVGAFAPSIPDPSARGLFLGVGSAFSPSTFANNSSVYAFVNGELSAFSLAPLPPSFLGAVEALGPLPARTDAQALANATIRNGTLATYPVLLPADALRTFISDDNQTMIAIVGYDRAPVGFGSVGADPVLLNIRKARANITDLKAVQGAPQAVLVTGNAATSLDSAESGEKDFSRIEPATIGAILVLVSLFFFAAFVVLVPLGSIGFALMITQGLVYLIGKYLVHVPDTTLTFLFTIVLGVGIDYAVFIMARYREERAAGADRDSAMQTAVTWAGESITTSGATVMIAFAILALSSFEFLQAMGYAVGVGVAVALAVSLTLIPALLKLLGNRIFWPNSGRRHEARIERARARRAEGHETYFRRAAKFSVNHAKGVILVAVILSVPTTYISFTGTTSFDFIAGLPDTESSRGLDAMQAAFGAGQLGPTQIVVVFPNEIASNTTMALSAHLALDKFADGILNLSNVREVSGPTRPKGVHHDPLNGDNLTASERSAIASFIGKDNRTALLAVVFSEEPFTQNSMGTVKAIRALAKERQKEDATLGAAKIYVGGQSALTLDFADSMGEQFLQMRVLVVIAIYIILLFVLGSYLLPLSAVLSVTLSITWAFAATLLFFNNVLGHEVLFLIPLILFILLMGIGMDYNIFILTRIREESEKGKSPKEAAVDAVEATGGIITALALILASALGSLMLSENTMLQGFGFAIAFAVVLDAMVVRTYIVPAVMALLGPRAWVGPKRLRRVGPAVPEATEAPKAK